MYDHANTSAAASSLPSSSERSSSSAIHTEAKEGMESDEEIRRVPEMSLQKGLSSSVSGGDGSKEIAHLAAESGKKTRGRNPGDKESKRLKRLLRNRVSAQQARERKKVYVSELETKVNDIQKKNTELEEKLSTLQNENQMLRLILKNTTTSRRGSNGVSLPDGS